MGTIVFDLDGVIATGTKEEIYSDEAGWAYEKCEVVESSRLLVSLLFLKNHTIIINTARPEVDREKTIAWLDQNAIPFSRLYMNKPRGEIYIDDRNYPKAFFPGDEATALEVAADIDKTVKRRLDRWEQGGKDPFHRKVTNPQ